MPGKSLAVDANILVRAVLGKRVREVIVKYAGKRRSSSRTLHLLRPRNTCQLL